MKAPSNQPRCSDEVVSYCYPLRNNYSQCYHCYCYAPRHALSSWMILHIFLSLQFFCCRVLKVYGATNDTTHQGSYNYAPGITKNFLYDCLLMVTPVPTSLQDKFLALSFALHSVSSSSDCTKKESYNPREARGLSQIPFSANSLLITVLIDIHYSFVNN